MNIASLFDLAGPDLIVILLIVLLLFGARKTARQDREERSERPPAEGQPGTIFGLVAVIVALICFLLVLSARWAGR